MLRSCQVKDSRIKQPLRLAFLTDLHGNSFGFQNQTLIRCILDARPNAVLMGGDMMVVKPRRRMDFSPLEDLLAGLSGRFPIYYAEGNHEQRMKLEKENYPGWWEEFVSILEEYDVKYLLDEGVSLGPGVDLWGVDIELAYYRKFSAKKMPPEYLELHLPREFSESRERFHILMAHTPQHMERYWQGGSDLVLSGHYHGGTVVLPFAGPVMSPQFRFFPKYARGWYEQRQGTGRGIVSAGLGTHSINIRLFNRPELVMIDLLPEEMD